MNSSELKNAVKKWADEVGHREAVKKLVSVDIGVAVAQKLITGTYISMPKHDTALALIKLLSEEGVIPERAS